MFGEGRAERALSALFGMCVPRGYVWFPGDELNVRRGAR
jgi:hypothetical protein